MRLVVHGLNLNLCESLIMIDNVIFKSITRRYKGHLEILAELKLLVETSPRYWSYLKVVDMNTFI